VGPRLITFSGCFSGCFSSDFVRPLEKNPGLTIAGVVIFAGLVVDMFPSWTAALRELLPFKGGMV
jgi:hypothetical protein